MLAGWATVRPESVLQSLSEAPGHRSSSIALLPTRPIVVELLLFQLRGIE